MSRAILFFLLVLYDMPLQKKRRQNCKRVVSKKAIKQNYNSYFIEQKRQVVIYAKENGIVKAAESFELDKGMVSC